jgi:hypothetical protein
MKRLFQLTVTVLLLLTSGLLLSCGSDTKQQEQPLVYSGYAGNFLSWTGSDDTDHYFTLVLVNGMTGSVTNIGGDNYFPAMAYAPDGTLYGISRELHVIDPATGSTGKSSRSI